MGCTRAVVLVLCAAVAAVSAWGPASHYYFTCRAAGVPLDECIDGSHRDLLSGTEMPDAFGFGALLSPVGVASLPCGGWKLLGLHSPVFAGYLYKNAAAFNTSTFDAFAFAVGFGMHVSADAAGFYEGGYLGYGWPQRDGYKPPVNESIAANWLSLWPFMAAVDAHVTAMHFAPLGAALPTNVPAASNETAAFIESTIRVALADNVSFPDPQAGNIAQCAVLWQAMVAEESIKAERTPKEVYGFEMQYNDRYGATSPGEAIRNFEIVAKCAVNAAATWRAAIALPDSTPMSAVGALLANVTGSYALGQCQPPSS